MKKAKIATDLEFGAIRARQPARRAKQAPAHSSSTTFQRFTLGLTVGLVMVGAVAAIALPMDGATRSPRASLELLAAFSVNVNSIPVISVEREKLPAVVEQKSGPTISQIAAKLSYDLDSVIEGISRVPRVFVSGIPHDITDVQETEERKMLFFKSVLPLVLRVNEGLLADRERLLSLRQSIRNGVKPSAVDRLWLAMMSERYGVERDDIPALLERVDVIPPSMAIAQAASESGWGTSRFAREGNALFGQWTFATGNLVPENRDEDKAHMVKRFNLLIDSVRGYARNLNTNRAYQEFRELRAKLRSKGLPLDGRVLVGELYRYSERGVDYVNEIRSLISFNKLNRLDDARLTGKQDQPST